MDDGARYELLRSNEEQYSLWLVGLDVRADCYRVRKEGSKDKCLAYVDEVWMDMRAGLREQMTVPILITLNPDQRSWLRRSAASCDSMAATSVSCSSSAVPTSGLLP